MEDPETLRSRVADTIRRRRMTEPGDAVLVGVSGGADSVCLLHVLRQLEAPLRISVAAAHLNHGWRGADSDQDARFVEALARDLGVGCFTGRMAPPPPGGGNLEEVGREARRAYFAGVAREHRFSKIALAHTRDDRIETFLLHLVRGAGPEGLLSMRPARGTVIRPLIETPRTAIEAYLNAIGQPWRSDATNRDPRFARNRMRREILPRLAAEFNPRLAASLERTIEILEAEDEWMNGSASAWLEGRTQPEGGGLVVDIHGLDSQPRAVVRRVLRQALRSAGYSMRDLGFDHLESLRALVSAGKSGRVVELPGRFQVERNFDALILGPAGDGPGDYEYTLPIPGSVYIPEIGAAFTARLRPPEARNAGPASGALVDGESLGPCVKIRNWRNGDFYNPVGLPASKLKTLFQKGRIPRRQRRLWPVLVAQSSIVWVASFPVSRDHVPTDRSRRIVEFEAAPRQR